jgi:hypothetical protein
MLSEQPQITEPANRCFRWLRRIVLIGEPRLDVEVSEVALQLGGIESP